MDATCYALRPVARRGGTSEPAPSRKSAGEPEQLTDEERWLRCAACGARVVHEKASLVVNGSHEHAFMNPTGVRFVVSCWSSAPGCLSDGERSTVWTWFPGFAWQVELCRSCSVHLGWSFHAATTFYGLIRDRLAGP